MIKFSVSLSLLTKIVNLKLNLKLQGTIIWKWVINALKF